MTGKQSSSGTNAADSLSGMQAADDPMTDAQRAQLRKLSQEAGEPFDGSLTKAEAEHRLHQLKQQAEENSEQGRRTAGRGALEDYIH